MELLVKTNMIPTVMNLGPYYRHLIQEFIINLPCQFSNVESLDFHSTHVQGHCFVFTAAIIIDYLDHHVDDKVIEQCPTINDHVFELIGGVRKKVGLIISNYLLLI